MASKPKCLGVECANDAGALQCPTCLKLGKENSYFCSQDCFKRSWVCPPTLIPHHRDPRLMIPLAHQSQHKAIHKTSQSVSGTDSAGGFYNPFPNYTFTGSIRPVYPLSARRAVPESIGLPEYAKTGIAKKEQRLNRTKWDLLDAEGRDAMRKVSRIGREVLDAVAAEVRPGVSTDYLDQICHQACIDRDSYPSPLNYNDFPKSLCTSPNEIVCHGIPDHRILLDGDIVNLDISVFHNGYHTDLNETYYVGERAKADPDSVKLIETTRECLDKAIQLVKPGTLIREFGKAIEAHAKSRGCSVIATWGGHGINTHFHPPPWIPHYAKNKAVGACKPGMTFTIEPILTLGKPREVYWPDKWTNATVDGQRTAQFEHTLLVTETGVEVLTARLENSPGGPVPMPTPTDTP
ncbi:methionine aminopeptidase 1 [Diaporthe eres]|nr:methionine aminopeptidase 1 [Diaporthe eres]